MDFFGGMVVAGFTAFIVSAFLVADEWKKTRKAECELKDKINENKGLQDSINLLKKRCDYLNSQYERLTHPFEVKIKQLEDENYSLRQSKKELEDEICHIKPRLEMAEKEILEYRTQFEAKFKAELLSKENTELRDRLKKIESLLRDEILKEGDK